MEILEHSSTKHHKVSKDEGSVKRERDNNTDELLKRNNIKRKKSRSPIEEPSSSKHYIENTQEDKVIRSGHSYKSERKRSSRPRHGDEDEICEYPDSKTENNKKIVKCRSKSPSTSNTWNERYTKTLPPGAKERREQQEKERQEQLKKDYANLSYGGKVVAGDGSSTGDYTTIKDGNKSEAELIEADSTSNAENENLNEEDSIEEDNEIPLEDILQGKNPILYCTLGAKFRDLQLEFDQIKEEGPQHDRIFTWKMKIGNLETVGTGNSKKSAKNDAAEKMVRLLYKAPRPMRKPMWGPYGPPCAMFPPGMPGPLGMFPPFPRGFRPPPDMIRPPIGMFGPRPGMSGPSSSFGGSFGPFPPGFLGPRPPFNGPMQFPMPRPEMLVSTPEDLEFGSMTTQNCEENELAPPGEVRPSSTMDSLFEVKAGSSTMDSLYQPEEGSTSNTYVQPTTIEGNNPPQFDRYAGANNPISKLYDMAKKEKIPEPLFETINEKVLSERKSQKGFTMKKTEYTIQCDFKGKKYEGKALTKKDAKLAAATLCWAEAGGGLPPGPASLQASISTLLQNQRQAASETKPQVKTPAESRPGDWQCSNEECGNINFAWRKECNNCDTKKIESIEKESCDNQDKRTEKESRSGSRDRKRDTHSNSHDSKSEMGRSRSSRGHEYDNRVQHRNERTYGERNETADGNSGYSRHSSRPSYKSDRYREFDDHRRPHRSERANHKDYERHSYQEHNERSDRHYDYTRSENRRHDRDITQSCSYDDSRPRKKYSYDDGYGSQRGKRDSHDNRSESYRERYGDDHRIYEAHPSKRHGDRNHQDRYR